MISPPSAAKVSLAWAVALLLAAANGFLLWERYAPAAAVEPPPATTVRMRVRLPDGVTFEPGRGSSVAIAPDGAAIVFRGRSEAGDQLYLRTLAQFEAKPIPGTTGAADPFFSADGRSIGFFADGKLKRAALDGSAAVTLADAPNPRGSTWAADGFIYLTPRNNTGVWRVPSAGGKLEPVTALADGQLSHRWPSLAPGGKALLYTIWNDNGWGAGAVVWFPLDGRPSHVLVDGGGFARIIEVGHGQARLVYSQGRSLMSAPFDLAAGTTTGPAASAIESVQTNLSGGSQFDVSTNGSLTYITGAAGAQERDVVWVDRDGQVRRAGTLGAHTHSAELSPDASRLAHYRQPGATREVWINQLPAGTSTQLTMQADPVGSGAEQVSANLAWSRDGRQLAYASGTVPNLFRVFTDRPGSSERLTTNEHVQTPGSWSPDGRTLAYVEVDPLSGKDIWLLELPDGAPARPRPFLRTPFNEVNPVISPNARWIAYHSNESGRFEVYVQPYPGGGRQSQISVEGGAYPRWSPDSQELFFIGEAGLGTMMVARLDASGTVESGALRTLFDTRRYDRTYAVSPDGRRLLMTSVHDVPGSTGEVLVVLNWRAELHQAGAQP